ncbi:MAG: acyl-CoA dehydrogenase family protein, partial [Micromonosporaceae bacterium]
DNTGWRLDGEAHYVLDGDIADVVLVAARSSAPHETGELVALFEIEPAAARREATAAMDPTRRLARVTFDATPARRLGEIDLPRVRDIACAALAAEQVGAAARALELTVAYAKTRVQFGQPIGALQALKHRMADMYVLVESARSAAYAAAADPSGYAPVAKVYCSEALQHVTAEMIQLHGGIAITWEHNAHLYFKRGHGSAQLLGQPRDHIARVSLPHPNG